MAFFGLTQLGYQDAIREHMNDPPKTPQATFRSGDYRDPSKRIQLPLEYLFKEPKFHFSIKA